MRHQADAVPVLAQTKGPARRVVYGDLAFLRLVKTTQQIDDRAFAATARADERVRFALFNFQVKMAEYGVTVVGKLHIFERYLLFEREGFGLLWLYVNLGWKYLRFTMKQGTSRLRPRKRGASSHISTAPKLTNVSTLLTSLSTLEVSVFWTTCTSLLSRWAISPVLLRLN